MINENMMQIIEERRQKHIEDDYGIQECWDKMLNVLSEDLQQTIEYLENCTKEEMYYISEILDDMSERLQSNTLIECLRRLDKKFPELNMTDDIDIAESYI